MAILVLALVIASVIAEMRWGAFTRDSAFDRAGKRRGVVSACRDGFVGDVVVFRNDGQLPEHGSLLQVAIGDAAFRVVRRNKLGLDVRREGAPPDVGLIAFEEHSSHAWLGRVRRPYDARLLGHDFG